MLPVTADDVTPVEGELLELSASRGFAFFLECVRTVAVVIIAVGIWFV